MFTELHQLSKAFSKKYIKIKSLRLLSFQEFSSLEKYAQKLETSISFLKLIILTKAGINLLEITQIMDSKDRKKNYNTKTSYVTLGKLEKIKGRSFFSPPVKKTNFLSHFPHRSAVFYNSKKNWRNSFKILKRQEKFPRNLPISWKVV